MIKYEIQYRDMKLGIAHLTDNVRGDSRPLAVIYAEGKSLDHMNATIDLMAAAFDLLNARLAEIRKNGVTDDETITVPEPEESNLAWFHRELERGNPALADRL